MASNYECPTCAAPLTYEPGTDQLRCGHCKATVPIPAMVGPVAMLAYDQQVADTTTATLHVRSLTCTNCGGTIQLSGTETAGACPFCKTPFVDQPTSADVMRPQAVVPFAVPREKAAEIVRHWIGSRRFAPSAMKAEASVDRLAGVYLPAWRFNADTTTDYVGERGDNVMRTRTVTDSEGKSHDKQVTETVWHGVSGRVEVELRELDVVASKGVHENLLPAIQGATAIALRPFREEYLVGFVAETYETGLAAGWSEAKEQSQGTIDGAVRSDIGGDSQRVKDASTAYANIAFLLLVVPVWIVAYQFRGKSFQLIIDGHEGDVRGQRPFSVAKIAALATGIVLIVVAIVILVKTR